MEKGVYTVVCPDCGHQFHVHIDAEGNFDPNICKSCQLPFINIRPGVTSNDYVLVVEE